MLGKRTRMPEWTDRAAVIAMAAAAFVLQAWHLRTVTMPITDEGVYAVGGILMMHGAVPHADFPLWHMPLLPFLMGIGMKLLGGLDAVRFVYLAVNCLAVLPLFAVLKRLTGNRLASVAGIAFYLTFYEMMAHDFRLLAIRQAANVLFIIFAWCHVCAPQKPWRSAVQLACAVLSAMLFLPAAVNLAVLAGGLVLLEPRAKRREELRDYALMFATAGIIAVAYLLTIDGAFRQVVLEQLHRPPIRRSARLARILARPDALIVLFGTASLAMGAVALPRLRAVCVTLLAVCLLSVYLPSNYFEHYVSLAGPALAGGMAVCVLLVRECAELAGSRRRDAVTLLVCAAVFIVHARSNVPFIWADWSNPGHPPFTEVVAAVAAQPEPVLTTEALIAGQAGRVPVLTVASELMRPPTSKRVTVDEVLRGAEQACTIVVENGMKKVAPDWLRKRWESDYKTVFVNSHASILRTDNPGCEE